MEQKFSKKSAPATLTDYPERHDRTPGAISIVDAEAVREDCCAAAGDQRRHYESRGIEEVAREFSADE